MWRWSALILLLGLLWAAVAWLPAINDEEQLQKLTSIASGSPGSTQHAAAPDVDPPPLAVTSAATRLAIKPPAADDQSEGGSELVSELQKQLLRVGCYKGPIDGQWNAATRRAVARFNDRIKLQISLDTLAPQVLPRVRSFRERACGTPCPPGTAPDDDGACMTLPTVAAAAPDAGPATPVGTTRVADAASAPGQVLPAGPADSLPLPTRDASEAVVVANAAAVAPPGDAVDRTVAPSRTQGSVQPAVAPRTPAEQPSTGTVLAGHGPQRRDIATSVPAAAPPPGSQMGPALAVATRAAPQPPAGSDVVAPADVPVVAVLNALHPDVLEPVTQSNSDPATTGSTAIADKPRTDLAAATQATATTSAASTVPTIPPPGPVATASHKRHPQLADINSATDANTARPPPRRHRNLAATVLGAVGYAGAPGGDSTLTIVLSKR